MFQNAPDLYKPETKYDWLKVIKQSKELLNWFCKKNIAKRFVAFLQEECKDLWLDHKEITKIINRLTKYYSKKNSVKDLQAIISSIESLFTNQKFIDRLESFLSDSEMTDFAKTFFYKNGRFNYKNLKDSLLARLKRYNLSYKAIGDLSKKEILDVLQVNNRFKGEDKLNHRIIDVKWRWKDKIFLLQNYKTAKMIDGKLVIIGDNSDKNIWWKDVNNKKEITADKTKSIDEIEPIIEANKIDTIDKVDEDKQSNNDQMEDQNWLSKIDQENKWDIDIKQIQNKDINIEKTNQQEKIWVSWKKYKLIQDDTRTISRSRKSVKVIDEKWNNFRFILMPDWTVLDTCISNEEKDYEVIDYISAYQNTWNFDIVKIKDTNGQEQNLRLLVPEYWKFVIQKRILIKKKSIKSWFMQNSLIKAIYKFFAKEDYKYDNTSEIIDFSWDEKRQDFVYTLSNWEKINMDNVNIK